MAPRILFLDDDRIRHDTFAKRFANAECVHVETFDEFERALLRGSKFDVIFLDHDLNDFGNRSVMESVWACYGSSEQTELTGTDAAVLVAGLPTEKKPEQVVVHTHNPPGGDRMVLILEKANIPVIRQPFKGKQSGPKLDNGERSIVDV